MTEPALAFDTGDDRYLAELVAIPAVSRDTDTATMLTAAQWLADRPAFANGRGVTDDKGPACNRTGRQHAAYAGMHA